MKQLINKLCAGLLIAFLLPSIASADVIIFSVTDGSITAEDDIAIDSAGSFFYDLYDYTATSTDPIQIFLETTFGAFYAWGTDFSLLTPEWPAGSDAPYASFTASDCRLNAGISSIMVDSPVVGQNYQIFVSSCFYVDDSSEDTPAFGDYTITIATITDVPEPGTFVLLGLGLIGLAASRRRRMV